MHPSKVHHCGFLYGAVSNPSESQNGYNHDQRRYLDSSRWADLQMAVRSDGLLLEMEILARWINVL